jgi:hypothetical protein
MRSLFYLGTPSPNPWDLSLSRQNGFRGGQRRPVHSGLWVGAPVASLRCHILRPGKASINGTRYKYLPVTAKLRYKLRCSEARLPGRF